MKISLLALLCMDIAYGFHSRPYIIAGRSVAIETLPHQVSLQSILNYHLCGASIIGVEKLVTAAHCTGKPAWVYRVRAGSSSYAKGGQTVRVSKFINHPDYCASCSGHPNDIAVVKIAQPIQMNENASTIEMTSEEFADGQRCTISGWGRTNRGKGPMSVLLQALDVGIVSSSSCRHYIGGSLNEGHICAMDPRAIGGAWVGDSGGPLTCGGQLVGAASWVLHTKKGCATNRPAVYSKIAHFRSWILAQE